MSVWQVNVLCYRATERANTNYTLLRAKRNTIVVRLHISAAVIYYKTVFFN